jgi:t-SNARE complex subunit (syntaxin)
LTESIGHWAIGDGPRDAPAAVAEARIERRTTMKKLLVLIIIGAIVAVVIKNATEGS